ncbi:radical SAM protein [Evansella sp. LMS18]|uniref:4Fe-4S single cluster domain-containing protein n=1 Tax=Evansella sp. LMS18 TaxID=2924033 RepID=UPI0020D1A696|nr:4Fe-4S single cluster domain-containing protein [Evansella sp. LMS18]UTR12090.1 radical SAM protein [Evansella sp. LMS18]
MQIERIYYPLKTLGYGNRVGIWTVGCPHRCFRCCNEELQPADDTKEVPLEKIYTLISNIKESVDGVTLSGGDPFFQAEELNNLVNWLKEKGIDDILIYSGFTLEELRKMNNVYINDVLSKIAVLIDGKYVEELNDDLPMRGSSNQRIHIFKDEFKKKYEDLLKGDRTIQPLIVENNIITLGIPPKNYKNSLKEFSYKKGMNIS